MNTHDSYVSLETAKLLKDAGFDWPVMHFYDEFEDGTIPFYSRGAEELQQNMNAFGYYSSPTLDVAQRWLREVHGMHVYVSGFNNYRAYREGSIGATYLTEVFDTYEEALEAGIKKALEIILEKGE